MVPPWMVSTDAAGSQRTSGAWTRRSLSLKVPVAAVLPTKNWAKSAVVAFRVRSERTVTSCSRPMPPAAKEASSVPSSARIVVVAFRMWRSAELRLDEVENPRGARRWLVLRKRLREPERPGAQGERPGHPGDEELQQTFDAVEPQLYDRIDGGKEQIGFVAQDVEASGKLGATMCKTKTLDGRELMALDYQKLSVVLWGVVKKLQKRVEKLEKKKGRKGDSD